MVVGWRISAGIRSTVSRSFSSMTMSWDDFVEPLLYECDDSPSVRVEQTLRLGS